MTERPKKNPCHTPTLYLPDGRVIEFPQRPTHKLKIEGYCKYCYRTHRHWWFMEKHPEEGNIVLCGYCEHTSWDEFI